MRNLLVVLYCCASFVCGSIYAQDLDQACKMATYVTLRSQGIPADEMDSRLAEPIEALTANSKVGRPGHELFNFSRFLSLNRGGFSGHVSLSDTSSTGSEKPNKRGFRGALIGGAIGAISGLVLHEIYHSSSDGFVCNEGDPGCTVHRNPRWQPMLVFGGLGAVIGFAVGK